MNWRRGFNRVFVLAAIGWAGYILLVYPMQKRNESFQRYVEDVRSCAPLAASGHEIFFQCLGSAEVKFLAFLHGSSPLDALRDRKDAETLAVNLLSGNPIAAPAPRGHGIDWLGALIVLGVLVLPPAAAYGLLRVGWLVLAWVKRGFRQAGG